MSALRCHSATAAFAALVLLSLPVAALADDPAPDRGSGSRGRALPNTENGSTPTSGDKPSTSQPKPGPGDETRGVIDDTPSFCDVSPPCPKGCVKDASREACIEAGTRAR